MAATPTTLVTGALGVGKTTAILHLLSSQPADARWAVLVNEFGEVGIDGGHLERDGLSVRELPGGCICCTAGVAMRVALVRILREIQPNRLLIEPTGLAHPASVIDTLRSPGLRESVDLRATLTLVDPRHLADPRSRDNPAWLDQIAAGDVLVATKTDLCTPAELQAFNRFAHARWPPPGHVAHVEHGQLDPAWLDLDPAALPARPTSEHAHHHLDDDAVPIDAPDGATAHRRADVETCGWIWPVDVRFDRHRLRETLQRLVRPCPELPAGALRVKGLFHTGQGWQLVQADPDVVRFSPSGWRRDSRLEVIAPTTPAPDWHGIDTALNEAQSAHLR